MRKLNWLVALVALFFGQSAMAVMYEIDWRTVDGAAFEGLSAGTDLLWGTGDDSSYDASVNPNGWSSSAVETMTYDSGTGTYWSGEPLFSTFFSGSMQTVFDVPASGISTYEVTSALYQQLWSCDPSLCGIGFENEEGGPQILTNPIESPNFGFSNGGDYDPLTQIGSFAIDMLDTNDPSALFGSNYPLNSFVFYGNTFTLWNGQNVIDFLGDFGAPIVSNLEFVLNSGVLPQNWVALEVSTYDWSVYDGISEGFGFRGRSVQNSYFTTDDIREIAAVPEPTTLGLFAAGLAGLGFLSRRRKQAH